MGNWAAQLPNAAANAEKTKLLNGLQLRRFISAGKAVAKSDGEGLTFTLSSAGTASGYCATACRVASAKNS